ncbi:Hypothetical protein DHA2_150572 [Giardia duodenalis]|uniref:Secreted protein n=1 Tax=Giardia intestinalis TaxID=5741 RepID=V6TDK3_GIAIN|nr:Hypothetical protein DHA2_150572 [Giardia intestinalis]
MNQCVWLPLWLYLLFSSTLSDSILYITDFVKYMDSFLTFHCYYRRPSCLADACLCRRYYSKLYNLQG